jgi:hypothetical protein
MMAGRAQRRWNARQLGSGARIICDGVSGRQSIAIGVKPIALISRSRFSAASKVSFG